MFNQREYMRRYWKKNKRHLIDQRDKRLSGQCEEDKEIFRKAHEEKIRIFEKKYE